MTAQADQQPVGLSDLERLAPGEEVLLPLPWLGRRVAYLRINAIAHAAFGPGGYQLRAEGVRIAVVRKPGFQPTPRDRPDCFSSPRTRRR